MATDVCKTNVSGLKNFTGKFMKFKYCIQILQMKSSGILKMYG
eukprot:CAMPEP_0204832480 /NCGR_PEP_ID=MMETSP1346-20131115/13832_1 /ASSEMBLY_ACC=CAM_ASM_000771 /TAXON_ID=215587 /ORGANISM="Aplanochytrium stocchinoi, Strain GSBS06" /LENGTH=42 /DNA_ID= /DNA_START= /DNA_END= /DNA_ORIENTATION=